MQANAAGATAAGGTGNSKCDFCDRLGLPILPLRYAVVPTYVPVGQGGLTSAVGWQRVGEQLKARPKGALKAHNYVLRTLRQGYVMVYFGSGLWNAYVVSKAGHLRRLADPDDPDFKDDREMSAVCTRAGHNVPASFINVPAITTGTRRVLPSKIWIAFSEVLWTKRIRQQYEGSGAGAYRADRMQEFDVDQLSKQPDGVADAFGFGQTEAESAQRLGRTVLEYAENKTHAKKRSEYDGTNIFDSRKSIHLKWSSAHDVSMRTGEGTAVGTYAAQWAKANGGKTVASAVVLNDPLGMVQELNATRLERMRLRQTYLTDERIARPLLISQSIVGLRQLFAAQSLAAVTEQEKGRPDVQTETYYTPDGIQIGGQTTTRQERADLKSTDMWQSLQQHYREAERAAFEKTLASTVDGFQKWLVIADADYAHWLADKQWVLRSRDFDDGQQHVLIEAFASALAGGPSNDPVAALPGTGPQDTQVYEVWKKFIAMHPADESNPIYVALFGKHKDILDYLLPDGLNPATDAVDKGGKLYKAIKTLIGTRDLTSDTLSGLQARGLHGVLEREAANKVANPVRTAGADALNSVRASSLAKAGGAAAHTMLALGGALNRLAAGAVADICQATAVRAFQGAVLLYERRDIHLITKRIKVRDYLAYLNDLAFNAGDAVLGAAAKGVRHVAQSGKATVRSMAVAGVLSIADKRVLEHWIDVTVWVYDDLNAVTRAIDALPAERQAARAVHDAAQAARAAESAALAVSMRVHPFSLSPRAAEFVRSVAAHAKTAGVGSAGLVTAMTRSSLRLASTGSGVLAVGSLVFQGWSLKDNLKKADAAFVSSNEARVLVVASSVATLGAVTEVVGVAGRLAAATWGKAVVRVGGAIGGAASIVEGVQAFMSSTRTAGRGDRDAASLYFVAGVTLVASGFVGGYGALTGAALLGPIGWALILIAVGVTLLYFAARAEDSQAAIWLDRCYWGKGSRFENEANPADRPWTNAEIDQELSQLNAVVSGLSGQTGFNDDGWGLSSFVWDTVKAKLTFPGFSNSDSAYEWRLVAKGSAGRRSVVLASGRHQQLPVDPYTMVVTARTLPSKVDQTEYFRNVIGPTHRREGNNAGVLIIEVSAEVKVEHFQDVELTVDYVADLSDPRGRASLVLNEKD